MSDFDLDPNLQIGTVFETSGTTLKISLRRSLTELVQTHGGTVYSVGQIGSLIKLHMGRTVLFAMVRLLRLQTEEEAAAQGAAEAMDRRVLEADLFGEARWQRADEILSFDRGVRNSPLPLQAAYLVTSSETRRLYTAIEKHGGEGPDRFISFGGYVGAEGVACHADMDKLFGQHLAVLGSTGSGKSTAVAAILHAVLDHKAAEGGQACAPRVIIIDPHGEYGAAFGDKAIVYRAYDDADEGAAGTRQIKLPYWLMSSDEFRRMVVGKGEFEATSQANVVYKALSHARMHMLDLVTAASDTNRKADAMGHPDVPRPAEDVDPARIAEFDRDWPVPFDLEEFKRHIEICQNNRRQNNSWQPVTDSEYQQKFASILDKLSVLRLDARIDFLMRNYVAGDPSLADVLAQFVGADAEKPDAPIRIIDISGLPTEVAGPLTAAIARLLFSYKLAQTREEREKDPILIVCEEAHRYVPDRGEAQYAAAQEAIRRIAREGRKYGMGLMLVSQRPSDVESTVLSQCNSWVVLRLTNGGDQEHVSRFLPDTMAGLIKLLPSLPRREALFVGEAAALPARIKLTHLPKEKRPNSNDISFAAGWAEGFPNAEALGVIATRMSSRS
ncbi:ATP-binding protein [Agrobacterium larrymoorei]|uniref:ATP-binding protein n=1 Tax=Agrobacterium larrymoorei TaxID=160699 RepID=UPI0015741D85|nr:ATP-binding protein [Agrobacterium larrymoorei]NTJ44885.1 ATP-binding protein [Agrobacterium larrymoorei]